MIHSRISGLMMMAALVSAQSSQYCCEAGHFGKSTFLSWPSAPWVNKETCGENCDTNPGCKSYTFRDGGQCRLSKDLDKLGPADSVSKHWIFCGKGPCAATTTTTTTTTTDAPTTTTTTTPAAPEDDDPTSEHEEKQNEYNGALDEDSKLAALQAKCDACKTAEDDLITLLKRAVTEHGDAQKKKDLMDAAEKAMNEAKAAFETAKAAYDTPKTTAETTDGDIETATKTRDDKCGASVE